MKSNFQIRLLTAVILVVLTFPTIYLPAPVFGFFVLLISLLGTFELFETGKSALKLRFSYFLIPLFLLLSICVATLFLSTSFVAMLVLAFVGICVWFVLDETFELPAFVYVLFTLFYTALAYQSLLFIRMVSPHYILFLFLAVFLTDTGAYFIGKRFGKHKLAPHLSPKKTIEGAIGGIVIGTFAAAVFIFILQFIPSLRLGVKPSIHFILIALMLSVASEFGDLFASKVKRYFNKKDFGAIFPGHGGVLDRVDGLVLASLVFYVILLIF